MEPLQTIHQPDLGERENAIAWLCNGEHGISSKAMFRHLVDDLPLAPDFDWPPADPADFRRCHLLLVAVPQLRAKLDRLRPLSPVWNNLVDNWDKLTQLQTQRKTSEDYAEMWEFMKSLGC